jgi:DegV family protein with EDD domain
MLLHDLAVMRDKGLSVTEASDLVNTYKNDTGIYLTVDTLEYLEKGGRVGKAAALAGSLLGIKPIITFADGELHPHSKVRGRKKAINELAELTDKAYGDKKGDYRFICLNADCVDECAELMDIVKAKGYEFYYPMQDVGVTVTGHTGPGVMGLGYLRNMPRL